MTSPFDHRDSLKEATAKSTHATQTVPQFLADFRHRRLGLVIDTSRSPLQGLYVAPAATIEATTIATMLRLSGGILKAALSQTRSEALLLEPMGRRLSVDLDNPHSPSRNSFSRWSAVSVEARHGTFSGISAQDRSATLRALGAKTPNPGDLVQPGHVFPIVCAPGGVLVCSDLAEAALDVTTMAGEGDCAAIMEALNESGDFESERSLLSRATAEGIPVLVLQDLIHYRLRTEQLVQRMVEARLPTRLAGELRSFVYRCSVYEGEHVALVKGSPSPDRPILVRVQPESTFTDVFGGTSPPSRQLLHDALRRVGEEGEGVILYLRRPVFGKLSAQVLEGRVLATDPQKDALNSQQRDLSRRDLTTMREYGVGAQILRDLGVSKVRLLSASSAPIEGIETFGIEIVAYEQLSSPASADTSRAAIG